MIQFRLELWRLDVQEQARERERGVCLFVRVVNVHTKISCVPVYIYTSTLPMTLPVLATFLI